MITLEHEISEENKISDQLREPFCFISGRAGSGKTTLIQNKDRADSNYIELTSTTGIAAINLGGRTINSVLKYFNTDNLEQSYNNNVLHHKLRLVRNRKRVLGIEEVSMLDAKQLDLIYRGICDINMDHSGKKLGLHLIGDLAQLPPVKADFIFKADCWPVFEKNTIQLKKIWRQTNPTFIEAMNCAREGRGKEAFLLLKESGVSFEKEIDKTFEGTTMIPNNIDVDAYNMRRLSELKEKMIRIQSIRRGTQAKEWEKNIPYELRLKVGAYVMILTNDIVDWKYVNGDCGWILDYNSKENFFLVKLKRNDDIVKIYTIERPHLINETPNESYFSSMFSPKQDHLTGSWIVGTIEYHPLRLAYASTIHKSQGLSLDIVQIDSRPQFFGFEAMAYVALSRARTPENLRIVINSEMDFISKIKMNKEVLRWI